MKCVKCEKEFLPTVKKVKGVYHYFDCPECGAEHWAMRKADPRIYKRDETGALRNEEKIEKIPKAEKKRIIRERNQRLNAR